MFESVVVLKQFLGDYVVNLDTSQLSLGIWAGAVALKNLEIKENALVCFDLYSCSSRIMDTFSSKLYQ